jgi:hypothetical protein
MKITIALANSILDLLDFEQNPKEIISRIHDKVFKEELEKKMRHTTVSSFIREVISFNLTMREHLNKVQDESPPWSEFEIQWANQDPALVRKINEIIESQKQSLSDEIDEVDINDLSLRTPDKISFALRDNVRRHTVLGTSIENQVFDTILCLISTLAEKLNAQEKTFPFNQVFLHKGGLMKQVKKLDAKDVLSIRPILKDCKFLKVEKKFVLKINNSKHSKEESLIFRFIILLAALDDESHGRLNIDDLYHLISRRFKIMIPIDQFKIKVSKFRGWLGVSKPKAKKPKKTIS